MIERSCKGSRRFLHLINSEPACLDATGKALDEDGQPVAKPWYEVTAEDREGDYGSNHME